ncbi:hypothetical protein HPB50_022871 [Hyalomma asiaticum]|uniref:Uncharacterized protein n=1 Tax=Hyalomma asiaticum TaxID=266040 RepID=A0ACB7T403_HYAAI|nr:hypothetical protein HPB50_022871 [Hyalomma asiaticum]
MICRPATALIGERRRVWGISACLSTESEGVVKREKASRGHTSELSCQRQSGVPWRGGERATRADRPRRPPRPGRARQRQQRLRTQPRGPQSPQQDDGDERASTAASGQALFEILDQSGQLGTDGALTPLEAGVAASPVSLGSDAAGSRRERRSLLPLLDYRLLLLLGGGRRQRRRSRLARSTSSVAGIGVDIERDPPSKHAETMHTTSIGTTSFAESTCGRSYLGKGTGGAKIWLACHLVRARSSGCLLLNAGTVAQGGIDGLFTFAVNAHGALFRWFELQSLQRCTVLVREWKARRLLLPFRLTAHVVPNVEKQNKTKEEQKRAGSRGELEKGAAAVGFRPAGPRHPWNALRASDSPALAGFSSQRPAPVADKRQGPCSAGKAAALCPPNFPGSTSSLMNLKRLPEYAGNRRYTEAT